MASRIFWDDKETAILIDWYIQYRDGKIAKQQAVANASAELRKRARECGMEIDDIFRNEIGIAMQMSKIEDLFLNRKLRLSSVTKVFEDTVKLYFNNRQEFDAILREARGISNKNTVVKEQFFSWLSKKKLDNRIPGLHQFYDNIESLCLSNGILKKSLFETVDVAEVGNVKNFVDSNKIFRLTYKKEKPRMQLAIKYYFDFVKELREAKNAAMANNESQGKLAYTLKDVFSAFQKKKSESATGKEYENILATVRDVLSEKLSDPLVDNIIAEINARLGRK